MATTDTRVVLWAAAAVAACAAVAVAVGTSAGARPATLSDDDIAKELAADGPTNAANPAPAVLPTGSGVVSLDAAPGTVYARCEEGLVSVSSWIPHLGYQALGSDQGPGPQADVRFQSDAKAVLVLTVTCVGGKPALQVTTASGTGAGTGAGAANPGAEPGSGSTGSGTGSGSGPGTNQGPGSGSGPGPAPTATPTDDHGGGTRGGGGGGHGSGR